jgi:hypothetical protein
VKRPNFQVAGRPAQLSPEPAGEPTRVEGMRAKIKAGGHASPYRLRKQLPVLCHQRLEFHPKPAV